jgi:hypothetical protein
VKPPAFKNRRAAIGFVTQALSLEKKPELPLHIVWT